MRFRIKTLQVVVVVAVGPLWTLRAGVAYGCPERVMSVWGVLAAVPLLLLGLGWVLVRSEPQRDQVLALVGAIAIVGYAIAIPGSLVAIGLHVPLR
jgi:hypothetical protein